jgi:hypothetical protein
VENVADHGFCWCKCASLARTGRFGARLLQKSGALRRRCNVVGGVVGLVSTRADKLSPKKSYLRKNPNDAPTQSVPKTLPNLRRSATDRSPSGARSARANGRQKERAPFGALPFRYPAPFSYKISRTAITSGRRHSPFRGTVVSSGFHRRTIQRVFVSRMSERRMAISPSSDCRKSNHLASW